MPKCAKCGAEIQLGRTADKKFIALDMEEINVHQTVYGKDQILTEDGFIISGVRCGDAREDGYSIGQKVHRCAKKGGM